MNQTYSNAAAKAVLKVGAGIGEILLPEDYFVSVNPDGTVTYEDGFNGSVHTFQGSKGVITDHPCIRVLLLDGQIRTAIVSMEIAQAPDDQIAYTKAIVSELCSVENDHIWVHSTHQFGFMHRPGDAKKAGYYDDAMKRAVTAAAKQAAQTLRSAVLGVGTGICNVSANRNIPTPVGVEGGPYSGLGSTLETNKTMTVLRFETPQGDPIAFFLSYGTKPSALCVTGKKVGNRALNSEVTGHASKWMEEEYGVPCIFCMPAAADQYPRETAQYHAFDETGVWNKIDIGFEKGIEIVDRLGREMGQDAIRIAKDISCSQIDAKMDIAATTFQYPNKTGDGEITVSAEALTLGDIAFVGFKQEMDCATERQIQVASPYKTTLLVSFLNGDGKYFAHREAYDFNGGLGTCETARSPFAIGAAEQFVQIITGLLTDLQQGKRAAARGTTERSFKTLSQDDTVEFAGNVWLVLERLEDRILILSRDVLEHRAYHNAPESVTWETCDLRSYLNRTWIDRQLSQDEAHRVVETTVNNPSNTKYGIAGGNPTSDKVFLLSLQEAEYYFTGSPDLLKARGKDTEETVWWHLRSPGEASDVAASVSSGGLIDYHGTAECVDDATGGIRPAMWLTID